MPIGFSGKHAHKFAVTLQNKKIIIIWRNGQFVPSAKNHGLAIMMHTFNTDDVLSLSAGGFRGASTPFKFFVVMLNACTYNSMKPHKRIAKFNHCITNH